MTKSRNHEFTVSTERQQKFVGRLITEARFARGLTPIEAANSIGVGRQAYYRWERGDIGHTTVKAICWLLQDRVESDDPTYWRERAMLAERRIAGINHLIVEYAKARRALETGEHESSPSSSSPPSGTRARAA